MKRTFRVFTGFQFAIALLACAFCFVPTQAPAGTLVVPGYMQNTQIANDAEVIFTNILREQTVYAASEFPAYPIIITEIRWRPDSIAGGPITTTISNIQVNLSTTLAQPDQLSLIFADNAGTDNTTVFSGAMNVVSSFTTLPNGTMAFDIDLPLQTPFVFDASKGNLLLDLQNFTGCNAPLYDNGTANGSDSASRIYNTSDPSATSASGGDTGAGVIQIVYTPVPTPPTITSQPTNQAVYAGDTATFTATAAGPPPLTYQWFFNDTNNPVTGGTNSSLTLVNLQTNQAGNYFLQVSNGYGLAFSSNAVLTVSPAPRIISEPADQTVRPGATATFTVAANSVLPLTYQWFFNSTNLILGATNSSLTLTNVQTSLTGTYSVQVANSFGSTNSLNASLNIGFVVPNASANRQFINSGEAIFRSVMREQTVYTASEFPFYPIIISEIRWRPDSSSGGPITTTISNIQVNLSTTLAAPDQLNFVFSQNIGKDDTMVFSGAMNVTSAFTTITNGTKAFDIALPLQTPFVFDSSQGNLLLDWRNFSGCTANLYNNGDGIASDPTSRIYNTSDPNATSASGGDTGGGVIEIGYSPAPLPPTIGSQPTNQTVTAGGTATFSVVAGPLPLSYQWYYHDIGQPITGATNSSLTLTNVQTGQAGQYFVQVNNTFGPTFSANALLTITTDPPVIASQPVSRAAVVGTNVTFLVSVTGSLPLYYQWYFNTNILIGGGTNTSLTLSNIQMSQAGMYSVQVTNAYGSTNSISVPLTVNFPVPAIRVISTNVMGGNSVDVPVVLVANGNENTLTFSLNFNTQRLAYAGIALGSGASDASLLPNTSQAANGRIGVSLQLPNNEAFPPGTQEVLRVTFLSSILTGTQPVTTPVNFTNQPQNKLLYDTLGNKLATNFVNGSVTVAVTDFEGDVTPRPTGDRSLDIFDWSQIGRFVAGLDLVTNAAEFQRADCAPKSSAGDGQLKVTDWVQAGRYAAAVDLPAVVGGPTAPLSPTVLTGGPRAINLSGGPAVKGLPFALSVSLQSQGNENAVGFSLNFDPALLKYGSVAKGSAAGSATIDINTNQAASGVLGVLLALPAGNNFTAGAQEITRITFTALNSSTNDTLTFSDQPVVRGVSDPLANELSANYASASVTINPIPALNITVTNGNATLSWPAWAAGFALQAAGGTLPAAGWTNVLNPAQTNGSDISVSLPIPGHGEYFRLQHP
jgi:hypothetical protein